MLVIVVVLPDHLRGLGARRNSAETQKSGHTPGSRIDSVEPTSRRGSGGAVPSNADEPKLQDKLPEGLGRTGSSLSTDLSTHS